MPLVCKRRGRFAEKGFLGHLQLARSLIHPFALFCRSRTAKVAVTTHKTRGIKLAVKAITIYTQEFGSMVSIIKDTLLGIVEVSSPITGFAACFRIKSR